MRKFFVGLGAVMVLFALPATAGAYYSAPPIANLSPASGTVVTASSTQDVRVEFTCPRVYTEYLGTLNWSSYWAEFGTSPLVNAENEFPKYNQLWLEQAQPTVANSEVCEASIPAEVIPAGSTVYWRATRINCEVECIEAGPTWSFGVAAPAAPSAPAPAPTTPPSSSSGESGRVTVYVGCGTSGRTKAAKFCSKNSAIGAFFKDSKSAAYSVCIHYPNGSGGCVHNQIAEAGTLYVDTIKRHAAGRYTVTWTVGGRRWVRRIKRTS